MTIKILVLLFVYSNLLCAQKGLYAEMSTKIPKSFNEKSVVLYHLFEFPEKEQSNKKNKEFQSLNYYLLSNYNNSYTLDIGKIVKGQPISKNSFKLPKSFNLKIETKLQELVSQDDLKFSDITDKNGNKVFSCNLLKINFLNENVEIFYYILDNDTDTMKKAQIKRKEIIRLQQFISFLNFIRSLRLQSNVFTK